MISKCIPITPTPYLVNRLGIPDAACPKVTFATIQNSTSLFAESQKTIFLFELKFSIQNLEEFF
jgi:hypothetical protein